MKFLRPSFYYRLVLLTVACCSVGLAQNPGPNVNMISGSKNQFDGDRFLQRQNEPTIAVSSRNADHMMAAANDYRTVDLALEESFPEGAAEAWMGVYRSYDRGRTWATALLPGYPQDRSKNGIQSPLFGLAAASDPVMASGLNGRIYLGGLAFDRGGISRIFATRYTDFNNIEGGDSFRYDFTKTVESGSQSSNGRFEDKPALAVDIPRNSTNPNACESVYMTFTQFTGLESNGTFRSSVKFARSIDCGLTWEKSIKISAPFEGNSGNRNQGTAIGVDPANGHIYVVWRTFDNNYMVMVRSTDGGTNFSSPISLTGAAPILAFDQFQATDVPGSSSYNRLTFRTNAFPTTAVDPEGRVHVAWQERVDSAGLPHANGNPRIVVTTSGNGGATWTPRRAADFGPNSGPQVMPSLTVGLAKDRQTGQRHSQLMLLYNEAGNPTQLSNSTGFISGIERELHVQVAQAKVSSSPLFDPPVQVSRYAISTATGSIVEVPGAPGFQAVNRPNLPMYKGGTTPFVGDYITLIPSVQFVRTANGWRWAVAAGDPGTESKSDFSYHAVWTDNRDAIFPSIFAGTQLKSMYGDWSIYSPPGLGALSCLNPGSRNSNIYASEISNGPTVGSPSAFKRLGIDQHGKPIQRAFIMYVQNTDKLASKLFRLAVVDNRTASPSVVGSFFQTGDQKVLDVVVFPSSTVTQAVYVTSADPLASVRVDVNEISGDGAVLATGYTGGVTFNGDPTNPQISNPQISNTEVHNPQISNPQISNPQISNPQISNPQISNPQISNPQISNPQISNAPLMDVTWSVTNDGNTTSVYNPFVNVSKVTEKFPGYQFQLFIYRTALAPGAQGCATVPTAEDRLVSVIQNPQISNPQISNPQISNSSFFVAPSDASNPDMPRDAVKVTLRIFPPAGTAPSSYPALFDQLTQPTPSGPSVVESSVTQTVVAGSIQTAGGELAASAPVSAGDALIITTAALPNGNVGVGYAIRVEAAGGYGDRTWVVASGNLPPGLNLELLTSGQALIVGTPSTLGDFSFTLAVSDTSGQTNSRNYSLKVTSPNTATAITSPASSPANPGTTISLGQSITFVASVTHSSIPTGTVSFLDNGTKIGTVALNAAGNATFSFSSFSVGLHIITAAYDGNAGLDASSSTPFPLTVDPPVAQPTATTLSLSPSGAVFGQPVALVAQVTSAVGFPTGAVTFKDGATILGTATLNPVGQASVVTTTLSVGAHTITAAYGGDSSYSASTSPVLGATIGQAETGTELTASPTPSTLGQPVTFTAAVSALPPSEGAPAGIVTFRDGATVLGTAVLNALGKATLTTSQLAPGTLTIVAVYAGNSNFSSSASAGLDHTVNQGKPQATSTTLSSSVASSVFGQPAVLTAAVGASGGTPTGIVTFNDGATVLGTGTLNSSGQVNFTTAALSAGAHTITATYNGDPNFDASASAALPHSVSPAGTATTISSLPNPSVFGQTITFRARVAAAAPSIGTPTGAVSFQAGGIVLGVPVAVTPAPDGSSEATLAISSLAVGPHSVAVSYLGDGNFVASTSAALGQTVNQGAASTSVASSQNPSVVGQLVTFTATVATVAPGTGTPTGSVTFKEGANAIGTGVLNGSGQATVSTSSLSAGPHSMTAVYGSDSNNFSGSTAAALDQAVNPANTSTSLVSNLNPSTHGQSVTFKVTVTAVAPGAGTPAGKVTFTDAGTLIGVSPLDGFGEAALITSGMSVGTHSITAAYGGDSSFQGSTSPALGQTVNPRNTSTSLVSSPNPSAFGQGVLFTATVTTAAPGAGSPTGSVAFKDGATPLGTGVLDATGHAVFSTSTLTPGPHSITAVYGGDSIFQGGISATLVQTVNPVNTSTALGSSLNPSQFGRNVTFTATVIGGAPSGIVTFKNGVTDLGTAALNNSFQAAFSTSSLASGSHAITAVYGGDPAHAGSTSPAVTQTVIAPSPTFANFSSTAGLSLVGTAAPSGNVLRLTSALTDQVGAAWYSTKQNVTNGFETTFQFQITDPGGLENGLNPKGGAEGIAFVIQNNSTQALGGGGGSLGYGGIANSLAVEFDTWNNGGNETNNGANETALKDNHISVHTNGALANNANENYSMGSASIASPTFSDGAVHIVKIVYVPGTLKVYLDGSASPKLTVAVDLATKVNLDSGKAFVGFTSSTGAAFEKHYILNWVFSAP
ncbi:MAG: Ig-like domain repeat protein [Acidobacteriota bacterium]